MHACVWMKACSQSVFVLVWRLYISTNTWENAAVTSRPSCLHCLSPPQSSSFYYLPVFLSLFFPFSLRNKGHSINFHSSPSPCQCIWAKNRKTDKRTKTKKKLKLLIWCQRQLEEQEEEEEQHRGRSRERELKWAAGITQVKLMGKWKITNVDKWRDA